MPTCIRYFLFEKSSKFLDQKRSGRQLSRYGLFLYKSFLINATLHPVHIRVYSAHSYFGRHFVCRNVQPPYLLFSLCWDICIFQIRYLHTSYNEKRKNCYHNFVSLQKAVENGNYHSEKNTTKKSFLKP